MGRRGATVLALWLFISALVLPTLAFCF